MNADILQRQLVVAEGFLEIAKEELATVRAELGRTHEMWKEAADELLRTRDVLDKLAEAAAAVHSAVLNSTYADYGTLSAAFVGGQIVCVKTMEQLEAAVAAARAALEKVRTL